jgi:hypothetical protein
VKCWEFFKILLIFQEKSPEFRHHRIEKKNSADNLYKKSIPKEKRKTKEGDSLGASKN